jgi:hypothetical protein
VVGGTVGGAVVGGRVEVVDVVEVVVGRCEVVVRRVVSTGVGGSSDVGAVSMSDSRGDCAPATSDPTSITNAATEPTRAQSGHAR